MSQPNTAMTIHGLYDVFVRLILGILHGLKKLFDHLRNVAKITLIWKR